MPKFFSYDFSTKISIVQSCLSLVSEEGNATPPIARWRECLQSFHPYEKWHCLERELGWVLILLIDNLLAILQKPLQRLTSPGHNSAISAWVLSGYCCTKLSNICKSLILWP